MGYVISKMLHIKVDKIILERRLRDVLPTAGIYERYLVNLQYRSRTKGRSQRTPLNPKISSSCSGTLLTIPRHQFKNLVCHFENSSQSQKIVCVCRPFQCACFPSTGEPRYKEVGYNKTLL